MEIRNDFNRYETQGVYTTRDRKKTDTSDYISELEKLVPSVELKVGNGFSSEKNGKTLTIHPQLLEKMQNDPEKEKEMKELIKGVESAVNRLDSVMNSSGWTVVFKHDYIDENGKYHQIALVRNDFMLNMSDRLREERRENSEKLLEKQKEKAAKEKEKAADSRDGLVYLYDTDIREIMEAVKEEHIGKADTKKQAQPGANLDLQV